MEYQTFRGSDVKEALFAVRQALGADALIESTRRVDNGRAGVFGRSFVEVVAAPSTSLTRPERPSPRQQTRGATRSPAAKRSRGRDPIQLERELATLRQMVEQLSTERTPRDMVRAMLSVAGFEGELATLLAQGGQKAGDGLEAQARWVREEIGRRLLCQPHLIERNFQQLIACVGPTGVGKTTTLAKLAARAKFELERSVSVISLDTFRVGAVEQWKRYAELIDIGFDVAEDATTFRRLVESKSSDLILVDTAGQSSSEDFNMLQLADCLDSVRMMRTEVQLVLPAWIRAQDAERIAKAYERPRLNGLIVTKVDESPRLGGCLHPALTEQLPVTYLCDGARVPEDIHDAAKDTVLKSIFPEQA